MHDVLRRRILRKLETLPEVQLYQVLDYIEFLESRYARHGPADAKGLQRWAEKLEDGLRKRTVNPSNLREAFQLISAADRVLNSVSEAGRHLLDELQWPEEEGRARPEGRSRTEGGSRTSDTRAGRRTPPDSTPPGDRQSGGERGRGPSDPRDPGSSPKTPPEPG